MNRTDIACFMDAARSGSFSATARELSMTQQMVSRHIRNIETQLGFELFFRGISSNTLTNGGKMLFDWLTKLNEGILWGQRNFAQSGYAFMHIGFLEYFGVLRPICDGLEGLREAGELREWDQILLPEQELLQALLDHRVDVVFLPEPIAMEWNMLPGLCGIPTDEWLEMCLVTPSSYVENGALRLRELAMLPLLSCSTSPRMELFFHRLNDSIFEDIDTQGGVSRKSDNSFSILSECICGNGYCYTTSAIGHVVPPELLYAKPVSSSMRISAVWTYNNVKHEWIERVMKHFWKEGHWQ